MIQQSGSAADSINALSLKQLDSMNAQGKSISDNISILATKKTADFNSAVDQKYNTSLGAFTAATDAYVSSAKSALQSAVTAFQTT